MFDESLKRLIDRELSDAYAHDIAWPPMRHLVEGLAEAWELARRDLREFSATTASDSSE